MLLKGGRNGYNKCRPNHIRGGKTAGLSKKTAGPAPKPTPSVSNIGGVAKAAASFSPKVQNAPTGNTPIAQYAPTGYSAGSAGATTSSTQNIDLVNKLFDAKVSGLQGQLGVLGEQQDASEARIGNQYTTKWNDLQENLALGQRNLGES